MTLVGKKFPSLAVNAMNEMGDTFQINVVEKAISEGKKVIIATYAMAEEGLDIKSLTTYGNSLNVNAVLFIFLSYVINL